MTLEYKEFYSTIMTLYKIRKKEEVINNVLEVDGFVEIFDEPFDTIVRLLEYIMKDKNKILMNWIYSNDFEDPFEDLDEIFNYLTR